MVFYIICIALTCVTTVTNFWHLIMYLFFKWRNITYLLTYLLTHCFAFPKNSFNFTTQKSEITEKLQVQPFNYKVTSKLYTKLLPITKFRFTLFQRLCLAFPKNGFNFVIQKFAIKWKILFPKAQNICF